MELRNGGSGKLIGGGGTESGNMRMEYLIWNIAQQLD